ncbi:hypothetical protein GCM10022237_06900 [Nocardioides ginsengisoli]|uniref:DnaJ family molecular chaperone n=1 Tax=Nocardioides ginsengisoli TaxID=363868 RepID=A0ABW3VUG6_9ACTN
MSTNRAEAFRVLGVPAGSDVATVARAYRRLARTTHPDVSSDPDAAGRFAALAAAFALASEPEISRPERPREPVDVRATRTRERPWRQPPIVAGPVVVRPYVSASGQSDD